MFLTTLLFIVSQENLERIEEEWAFDRLKILRQRVTERLAEEESAPQVKDNKGGSNAVEMVELKTLTYNLQRVSCLYYFVFQSVRSGSPVTPASASSSTEGTPGTPTSQPPQNQVSKKRTYRNYSE